MTIFILGVLSWVFVIVALFYLAPDLVLGETQEEKKLTRLMIKRLETEDSEDRLRKLASLIVDEIENRKKEDEHNGGDHE